jgi:hypothetical protein
VVFAFTLLLASILFFTRVRDTSIDLQVVLSEVELSFSADRPWTDAMQLSSLGASGLKNVIVPAGAETVPRSSIKLSVATGQRSGQLTLAPIFLPANSRVWLRTSDAPGSYRMSVQAKDGQFRADVLGAINIAGTGAVETFRSPQGFLLNGGSLETELEFVFLNREQNPFIEHHCCPGKNRAAAVINCFCRAYSDCGRERFESDLGETGHSGAIFAEA